MALKSEVIILHIVVSYDISSDARRNRVAKIMEGYGDRVQLSVFECDLTAPQIARLLARVTKVIDRRTDGIRLYHLCEKCVKRREAHGCEGVLPVRDEAIVI